MNFHKRWMIPAFFALAIGFGNTAQANTYAIDDNTNGSHAFITFRVKHLGFSWLYGRFDKFSGTFDYSESDPATNKVALSIDAASISTNHAERDKHIRSGDFLDVANHPTITFESTSFTPSNDGGTLKGNLTLLGVTKEIEFEIERIGGGEDPWGGYRQGFEGYVTIQPNDYGIDMVGQLGPAAADVEMMLSIEGLRQ